MTMRLSIVLAVQGGSARLAEVLECLDVQRRQGVEVLVCFARSEPGVGEICAGRPWIVPVEGAPGALVPHLWRDGILRATAPRVALSVVHCQPEPGWVDALLAADLQRFAGVGGAIDNDPRSNARGWAIFLLRYLRYAPPFEAHESSDLPGDNVVYDRRALLEHADALADGFWEPTIHALLIQEGRRLLLDPSIAVTHVNGYGAGEFARLRFSHGRRYGRDRAQAMQPLKRLLYLALSPAIPLVFGAKITRGALAKSSTRRALARAFPVLVGFLLAWAAGEMVGALEGVRGRARGL